MKTKHNHYYALCVNSCGHLVQVCELKQENIGAKIFNEKGN